MMYRLGRHGVMLCIMILLFFIRNDAMFALYISEATSLGEARIIRATTSFAVGKHHAKRATKSKLLFLIEVNV